MSFNNKRGQLTLFIIVGIIAVVGIGGYFAVSKGVVDLGNSAAKKFPEINSLVESCLKETALEGIYFNSLQGGYYNVPEGSIVDGFIELPVYFEDGKSKLPELSIWEEELNSYVEDNLIYCLDFSDYESRGYKVEIENIEGVKSKINENRVDVSLELKQSIKISFEGKTSQFKKFSTSVDFNYTEKYNALKEFLEFQSAEPEWIPQSQTDELGEKYGFTYEIGPLESEGNKLNYLYGFEYSNITNDLNDSYFFVFGVRYKNE